MPYVGRLSKLREERKALLVELTKYLHGAAFSSFDRYLERAVEVEMQTLLNAQPSDFARCQGRAQAMIDLRRELAENIFGQNNGGPR